MSHPLELPVSACDKRKIKDTVLVSITELFRKLSTHWNCAGTWRYSYTFALLPVCLNAAKPGVKMPVTGLGTWGYVHEPGTGRSGEVWNDTVAGKAVKE